MRASGFDVKILGAGPVGAALALALQDTGLSVALIVRRPAAASGAAVRAIALSHASRLILERIGAWDALKTTPIEQIHVSQAGAFGRTRMSREDVGLPALGYVASYDELADTLARRIDPARIRIMNADASGEAEAQATLTVHAEGASAGASVKDYGHCAIVTTLACDRPAQSTAWERFTDQGPLALLPLGSVYGVVWSRSRAQAEALMQAEDEAFLAQLQAAFGRRAGRFVSVGPRDSAALVQRRRRTGAQAGVLYIGNAAQTLHPVAGQGLNLGLRDAWDLADILRRTDEKLDSTQFAERFARARRLDACATLRSTDLLATLFTRGDPIAAGLRGAALTALDLFPAARRALARRMIYGASAW